jgi:hypothetical protein
VLSCRMNVASHPAQAGSHRFFRHLVTSLPLCLETSPLTLRVLCAVCGKTSFLSVRVLFAFSINPFRIRTSAKYARNSFRIRTSKSRGLKVSSNHTLTKRVGGGGKLLARNLTKVVLRARRAFAPDRVLPTGRGGLYGKLQRRCPMLSIAKAGVAEGASLLDRSFSKAR